MGWRRAITSRYSRARSRGETTAKAPISRAFHRLWYDSGVWHNDVRWQGVKVLKNPLDMWVYQEVLHATRPDLIIETGTFSGGSALFLAHMLDINKSGKIASVDIKASDDLPAHPRITYLIGSSVSPDILSRLQELAADAERVMVILDSDHSCEHVLRELRLLAPLVTPGCYLVVEDTNINGHPALPAFGPGPMEAVKKFLIEHKTEFTVDSSCERFLFSFNPSGWLLRTSD